MGGFADLIGGVGAGAGGLGKQLREQQFQHQENALRLWQIQHQALADAVERNSAHYAGPEGERLRDLQIELGGLQPGTDLSGYHAKYSQHSANAQKALEQKAAADAATIKPVAAAPPPTAQNSNPFAGMIGGAPAQSPPTALPPSSPVSPQSQGGGSTAAAFPPPSAPASPAVNPGSSGSAPAEPVPPVPVQAGPVPGANSAVPPPGAIAPGIPPLDFSPSASAFNSTGYIDPVIEAMIPGQAGLSLGMQKLPLVRGILDQLGPDGMASGPSGLPDLSKLMRVQAELSALGVQGGGMNMLGPMLTALTPQAEAGQTTVGDLEVTHPGFLKSQGYHVEDLDPSLPVRVQVNKFTRAPVSAQIQSYTTRLQPTAEGLREFDPRLGTLGAPIQGATPIGMVPTQSSATQHIPGQLDQTTTTTRSKLLPGVASPGTPSPGALKPIQAPSNGSGGRAPTSSAVNKSLDDNSPIASNYRDWIAGRATLSDKEQTAARSYAASHGLPTPEILSPSGQKAVASIQPIYDEVRRAKKLLESAGLHKMSDVDSKLALGKEFAKYKYLKINSPLAQVISDLSFDSLRSVGQALQGTGSRAYPIFSRALEHTPSLGLNSDSGALIYKKLDEMETRLKSSLDAAYGETKSGVVAPGSGPSSAIPSIPGAKSDPLGIR